MPDNLRRSQLGRFYGPNVVGRQAPLVDPAGLLGSRVVPAEDLLRLRASQGLLPGSVYGAGRFGFAGVGANAWSHHLAERDWGRYGWGPKGVD